MLNMGRSAVSRILRRSSKDNQDKLSLFLEDIRPRRSRGFEDDLPMLNKKDVLYLAPKGEDFDYTSILADCNRKDILEEGGFGKVYSAISRETGKNVAIKLMNISHYLTHADQVEKIYREADAMEKLNHNHIIKLYKAFLHKKEVILIMEYAGDGELAQRVDE